MRLKVIKKQPNSKMCFVCGLENRFGLKSRFYELEDGRLMAVFTPLEEHQGYPGRLHGGIAATILDETIGRAIMLTHSDNIWGITIDFSMKLRKPVPIDGEIKVVARIEKEGKRSFTGVGEILLADGRVAIEGRGKYLKMDIEKIADFDHEGDEWRVVELSDDPQFIEVGS
jgi:uncharacterized protein (TIGR00369 family)